MLKDLYFWCFAAVAIALVSCNGSGETHGRIAVATNFLPTAQSLEIIFEAETGFTIDLVSGSTGQLYTQIINGAPYDAFLSADVERVTRLAERQYGIAASSFTYAFGQLVLLGAVDEEVLKSGAFNRLALANPDLAPYGFAAKETLTALQLTETFSNKIIYGQNVGQAFGFVKTGNADLGFVALSQVGKGDVYWRVPNFYHNPIRQEGLLLTRGKDNRAAKAFMIFLQSAQARDLIKASGYAVTGET